ncbi:MAG: Fic family protein [Pseudomonadota bacterium]
MTKKELDLILHEGENYKIEFKENVNSDLSKEMVAMANSSGGRIFIGINDKNEVIGVKATNALLSKIQNMAQDCDPSIIININTYKNILIINVKEGLNKPYRCSKGFYTRNGSNSQKMTTREITEFVQAEGNVRFDEKLREDINISKKIKKELLNHYLQLANINKTMDDEFILENLGVLEQKNKKSYLNNAGLLFFCDSTNPHLHYANITCALYKGSEKLNVLDRKDFSSDIISNIEDTMLFLKKHLNLRYEITSLRRKEILELPEVALREAVVNAACHRDYFEKGANIMVEIFDDRVQITNPGGLPKGLLPEKFGTRSVSRNPLITSLFHRVGYIEKMGTGIGRIRKSLKESGNSEAVFEYDSFFSVIFKRSILENGASSDIQVTGQVTGQVPEHVTKLLSICKGELSRSELQDILKLKHRENFVNLYLNPALESAFIEMTIPGKPRSSKQKYRLTKKGKDYLKKLPEN